jgi:pimeloyl-ACP methyl ester carboxylesterase
VKRVVRIAGWVALVVAALVLGTIAGLLALRSYEQHVNAKALAIEAPAGIDEARYVRIGGIDQWISIRGQDRANPVLLCVHGGPGATWTPLAPLFRGWEQHFTVVQWDQRGAGKTLESTGPSIASTMTIDRMAQDGIEVAEYLRAHLGQRKIALLAHSWGSILGIEMITRRPELFYAYAGTGQVSSMPHAVELGYALALREAHDARDARTTAALETIGPPPYSSMAAIATYFESLGAYAGASDDAAQKQLGRLLWTAPAFSLRDLRARTEGFARVPPLDLYRAMLSTDLPSRFTRFDVPVFFLQGTDDRVTPASLARAYFDRIEAPRKAFVPIEHAGHFAVWTEPDRFLRELLARVRPLALQAPG